LDIGIGRRILLFFDAVFCFVCGSEKKVSNLFYLAVQFYNRQWWTEEERK